jgi:hypothetical protein
MRNFLGDPNNTDIILISEVQMTSVLEYLWWEVKSIKIE